MIPKASIIVLTYNRPDLVKQMYLSIHEHVRSTYEFIIMDNGDMSTNDIVKDALIIEHNNSGNFASMCNLAAQHARSDILIFLNNDTEAKSDFVTDMISLLENNEQIGIVGACLYYPNENLQHAGVLIQSDLFPANLGHKAITEMRLNVKRAHPHFWEAKPQIFPAVTGACLAIRKKDFMALGGFHDEFKWCFEDVDLCFRMGLHLKKLCVVSPGSVLIHHESESGGDRNVDHNLDLLRGRWLGLVPSTDHYFLHSDKAAVSS